MQYLFYTENSRSQSWNLRLPLAHNTDISMVYGVSEAGFPKYHTKKVHALENLISQKEKFGDT